MRRDRKDMLNELKRKRGRDLTAEEFEGVANLSLAEEFGNVKLANSVRDRFKVFDDACRRARRTAAERCGGLKANQ
ncbi:hypothetical protein [Bradyrhizobium sp. USDA 3315]